jgi:hypothetical protein
VFVLFYLLVYCLRGLFLFGFQGFCGLDEVNFIGFALLLSFQMHDSERRAFLASSRIWVGISTFKALVSFSWRCSWTGSQRSMISQVAMAVFLWLWMVPMTLPLLAWPSIYQLAVSESDLGHAPFIGSGIRWFVSIQDIVSGNRTGNQIIDRYLSYSGLLTF